MNRLNSSPQASILFLDDDPARASAFLADHPQAIWVQTVDDCLACLEEPWDEVHLDHDLCGEVNVDQSRADCGMAVVRWIVREPRPHLGSTRFVIHTRNVNAACVMLLHLQVAGFEVEDRPFQIAQNHRNGPVGTVKRIAEKLRRRLFA